LELVAHQEQAVRIMELTVVRLHLIPFFLRGVVQDHVVDLLRVERHLDAIRVVAMGVLRGQMGHNIQAAEALVGILETVGMVVIVMVVAQRLGLAAAAEVAVRDVITVAPVVALEY